MTTSNDGTYPFNLSALGDALVRKLTSAFESFRLSSSQPDPIAEAEASVSVYLGSVKGRARAVDGGDSGPALPMVLVRPRTCTDDVGETGEQRSIVGVDFVIGVRRIGNDGYLDVIAIAELLRRELLISPVVESRARLEFPLDIEIGEDDAFPQWFGVVSARYNIPQPVEEIAQ